MQNKKAEHDINKFHSVLRWVQLYIKGAKYGKLRNRT